MNRLGSSGGQLAALWSAVSLTLLALVPRWPLMLETLPSCRFNQWLHLPCLTCGSGRTLHALLEGDVAAAFAFNPLATLGVFFFFGGGILGGLWALGLGSWSGLSRRGAARTAWLFLTLVLANWVYLLLNRSS